MTFKENGDCGIGTTSPTAKFDVQGNMRISDLATTEAGTNNLIQVGENGILTPISTTAAGIGLWQQSPTNSNDIINANVGKVGIGTSTPDAELEIKSNGLYYNNTLPIVRNNGNAGAGWRLIPGGGAQERIIHATGPANTQGQNKLVFKTIDSTTVMVLTNDGKVGIGTTSPTNKLEVDGSIKANGASGILILDGSDIRLGCNDTRPNNGTTNNRVMVHSGGFNGKDDLYINYANDFEDGVVIDGIRTVFTGNVGINEPNPTAKLQITASGSDGLFVNTTGSNDCFIGKVNNDDTKAISIYNDATLNFLVKGNGKVWAREVNVLLILPLGDFVFAPDHKLMTIYELENYIKQEHHFPKMPSAKEVKENGMNVGEFQNLLLQQTEEQALYIISMQKQIDYLKKEIKEFSLYIIQLEKRINELEKK